MSAAEALRRGLFGAVSPRHDIEEVAANLAERLGKKDQHAWAENKCWINRDLKAALAEARAEHAQHRSKTAN